MTFHKTKIKIPAFEFETDLFVRENKHKYNSDVVVVDVEIDSFNNNIKSVLDKIVTKAIAKTLNKLGCKVKFRVPSGKECSLSVSVEGHSCVFPTDIYFYKWTKE